ncbi:MAG: isoaspartyl peptidase/L-asparaginase [Chloroflexota bacterium]
MTLLHPRIIVHGGAWDWPDEQDSIKIPFLKEATRIGHDILYSGRSALDAVEKAVNYLEDAPTFEAGTGVPPNQNGVVELDALLVDGRSREFGSVAGLQRVKYPISLARKVLEETDHCMFVGEGADQLARDLGLTLVPNLSLVDPESYRALIEQNLGMRAPEWIKSSQRPTGPDTVGAVAIDQAGNIAAATSTSGSPFKPAGRVGDAPLLGSGGYALNGAGGVSCTGNGENIMRVLLAKYACDLIAHGRSAQQAGEEAVAYIDSIYRESMAGMILVDHQGRIGVAHSTPKIAVGWNDQFGKIQAAMNGKMFGP